MAFTTVFFLFAVMPASVAGYYLIKLLGNRNERWSDWLSNLFLVLVSLCFYGWARLEGIALLSIYVLGVWMAGKGICYLEKKAKYKRKVCFMTISILAVTGILIWYKYYNFIAENLSHFFGISLAMSQWIVPLGISFITFTAISYLVDVFRGDAEAGSLLDVFLYLSFFPKVISGPIVQWKDFQRQTVHRRVDETEFLDGLNRIMIGFAKKVILADSFGAVISKGKSKSFFRHQSGDESVDRSSWNFFHHVYSDILSCGCLSWRCRGGKPFGCIFISFFFPKSDFRTDRTVERFSETDGTPQGR